MHSNLTPDSSGYYDGYEAQTRARTHYEYDGAGRLTWLGHYWDTLGTGNTYTSQAIVGQACAYETTGTNRGVRTDAIYKTATTPGSAAWSTSQTDTYGYDASLAYLTAASYGDGLANASPTWNYDAEGNRNDAVRDNLNRATSLGGSTVTSDILGNRLTKGTASYGWDILNRLTSFTSSGTTSYVYRADGMRVSKSNSTGSTSYRYDGQMGMEDIDFASNGTVSRVTDYGIGPRDIDVVFVTQNGSTSANYPIYDAHGNMISTLTKPGTGGFASSALRTFDAWGSIRRGAQASDPKGRFYASLGHKQVEESGLVYMRARFHEAVSGRFVSEDPAMSGMNLFEYANDNPVDNIESTGKDTTPNNQQLSGVAVLIGGWCLVLIGIVLMVASSGRVGQIIGLSIQLLGGFIENGSGAFLSNLNVGFCFSGFGLSAMALTCTGYLNTFKSILNGAMTAQECGGLAQSAIIGTSVYATERLCLLMTT